MTHNTLPYPSPYWADWSWPELDAWRCAARAHELVAVLPLGATEQHGPHLPLAVDTTLAHAMLAAAAAQLGPDSRALLLPTLPVGFSPEHAAFAGTLSLSAETCLRVWGDVAASVAGAGLRRLVLFNTHGGHVGLMQAAAREWRSRLGLLVYCVNWFDLPLAEPDGRDPLERFSAHERRFGAHAGQIETALMRAIAPEAVRLAQAGVFASSAELRAQQGGILGNGRSARLAWQAQDYHPSGAMGDAAAACAADGAALLAAVGQALAALLREVQALPLDTLRAGPLTRA